MACWVDHSAPTQRLLNFYQTKVREMRSKHLDLTRVIKEAKELVVKNADKEEEALRLLRASGELQDSLSEVQRYLYKEREMVLKLTAENDRLQIEKADDKRKIQFLLNHCGLKESQLYLKHIDKLAKPLPRKQKPKVRFSEVKDFSQKLTDFKDSEYDVLHLRIKSLEAELKEQTDLLQDEVYSLEQDIDLRKKEWIAEKKILEQKVYCLNCRLQTSQLRKLDEILEYLQDLDTERSREIKLMEENDQLRRSVNICKELLGEEFPDDNYRPSKHKEEMRLIKEQLHQKDHVIRGYQAKMAEFEAQLCQMRKALEQERENVHKIKERSVCKEEALVKKFEDERSRRLLEGEGFRNDIKLLRSKLQSIERQFKHARIRKKHQDKE